MQVQAQIPWIAWIVWMLGSQPQPPTRTSSTPEAQAGVLRVGRATTLPSQRTRQTGATPTVGAGAPHGHSSHQERLVQRG